MLLGDRRRIALRFLEGYRFAQVYAPPGSDFTGFEPITALINPFESDRTLLAEPAASYRARSRIAAV